jgi:beta-N-acetylhexosaminidase
MTATTSTVGELRTAGLLLPGFVGPTLPDWLAARLRGGLAGVCLFGQNVQSPAQLRSLTDEIRAANPLAIIAIDEEGGDVTRLHDRVGSPYPGNAVLGRIDDVDYTERVAATVGWELRRAGCNLDFAPDVDVNSNPNNPVIGVRSFGADPQLVARHSAAWIRGLQSTGIAASAKHFPGHGDTATDSHLSLPVIERSLDGLRRRELQPFRAAIAAGSRTIMTSHIMVPALDVDRPATFSPAILGDLLRSELGFAGVIVTDALDMVGASGAIGIPEAAVRAIAAGSDLLCIGTENTDEQLASIEAAIESAVTSGRLVAGRVAEAAARTAALAGELREQADRSPIPDGPAAEFDRDRTAAAFDVRRGLSVSADRSIVVFDTAANIAIGLSPWGPAAAGAATVRLGPGTALPTFPPGSQPVLVGKGNHRFPWVRETIDELRRRHPHSIVIDMGWPSDDRRYADVATFGASRHVGEALLAWLEDAASPVRVIEKESL